MYLYLRHGDSLELLSGVVLKDWYRPVVGDVGNDLQLEPAIWFKSLIIDAILIDCDRRQVRWSRVRMPPSDRVGEENEEVVYLRDPDSVIKAKNFVEASVFEDFDYSELDQKAQEIFEATRQLLIRMRKRELSNEQYKTELFRLLHRYIMPSILLTVQDIPILNNAFVRVKMQLKRIDKIIMEKDKAVQLKKSSLAKKQKEILENEDFTNETHILSCTSKFLQVFEKHIGKDVEDAWQELEVIQSKVDDLKLRNPTIDELGLVRKERDACYEKWEKIKFIQETIKQTTKSKRSSEADTSSKLHKIYIEINKSVEEEMQKKHQLCVHEAQITSVRKAIRQALDDLKTYGQTVGWQMKSDGTVEHDTDVMGMNCKPKDWYTLEEKISSILADVNKDITEQHIRFCSGVYDKITAALKENELFQNQTSSNEDEGTVFQSLVDAIKQEVNDHLLTTVKLLSRVIHEESRYDATQSNTTEKIAICYHNLLCNKIIEPLESLYEKKYDRICVYVFNKTKDMSFEELEIDEPWIVQCLTFGLSLLSIGKKPIDELREFGELDDCPTSEVYLQPSQWKDTQLSHPKSVVEDSQSETNDDYQSPPSYVESINILPSYGEHCSSVQTPEVQEGKSLYDILQPGLDLIHTLVRETTITGKLKMITKTYRFVGNQVSALKSAASLQDFMGSYDELLTLLFLLLTYLDERDFKRLFIQMYLLVDFKPQFMLGGVHDCSLTNFCVAFQYLRNRLVMHKVRRSKNEKCDLD
ncbi:putative leucine-rich repeat-containing protein DDB_G0290503 [Magallana gigas]|uniref:putative leucine-rich repeat-containing protein DDB_G0290503 n=1 Tax=Magallana gigas TaxID=29159 RepID=UPI00333F5B29